MNILVLHGENYESSFSRLSTIRSKCKNNGWEIINYPSDSQNLSSLVRANPMFSSKRLFIIESAVNLKTADLEFLIKDSGNFDDSLVICINGNLGQSVLTTLPKSAKVEENSFPKYIWSFLESFFPGNSRTAIFTFGKLKVKESPEMAVALLGRHLINLYKSKISPESLNLPSWKLMKIRNQGRHFTADKIRNIISNLAEIDILSKTSKGELPDLLDILMASKLG